MNGKKWVGLDEPMGDCRCCTHQEECAPLKQHVQQKHLNGNYRFRCPILIEVDENIEYVGLSKTKKRKGEEKKMNTTKAIVIITVTSVVWGFLLGCFFTWMVIC